VYKEKVYLKMVELRVYKRDGLPEDGRTERVERECLPEDGRTESV